MRNISSGLKAAIKSGTIASLIKITCNNGDVHAYTDSDIPLTVGGVNFIPAPGLSKLKQHSTIESTQVSNQTLESGWVDAPASDLIAGVFDEAEIRVSWTSWKNPELGDVPTFVGRLSQITWTDAGFQADIISYLKDLDRTLNILYIPTCRHRLFGSAEVGKAGFCGISASTFTSTGAITSIIANKWVLGISTVKDDAYYTGATITFTSGNNSGLSFEIKNHASNQIELYLPTAFLVSNGDTYSITAGCDKTLATCKNRFNNVINFGGFPSIQPQVNFR